ncbi:MAG: hypothetical protein ACI9D5_001605 [Candidatus Endobugula sp.]|jgi:hypothetical protein
MGAPKNSIFFVSAPIIGATELEGSRGEPQCKGIPNPTPFNLQTAVGREKDVQVIGVHSEFRKRVVTLLVMRRF